MKTDENTFHERVVKMTETCDGCEIRTFYCIHDPEFGLWMSQEPYDGMIWTKEIDCRREFANRAEAEETFADFLRWRRERRAGGHSLPRDREAA